MPIITLSSDVGTQDFIIGAVKGQFVSAIANIQLFDISHQLNKTNYPEAAYICGNAFRFFPAGSIHIVLLNAFQSKNNHWIVAIHQQQLIACPDNGILTMITGEKPEKMIGVSFSKKDGFLGRTASLIKALQQIIPKGDLSKGGAVVENIVEKYPLKPTIGNDWMEGQILFIDRFENVVVNIKFTEFEELRKGRTFKIVFKRNDTIEGISNHYADVAESEKMAFFNSAGYLEIAMNNGNMAGLFGLKGFTEKIQYPHNQSQKLFYQTVRIFFE